MVWRIDSAWLMASVFDRLEIGEITPPHEIEDVPRMRRRARREQISKDQV